MRACGVDLDHEQSLHGVEFFASHEALLLDYESALDPVRRRSLGATYDLSGHMVWIGERMAGEVDVDVVRRVVGAVPG